MQPCRQHGFSSGTTMLPAAAIYCSCWKNIYLPEVFTKNNKRLKQQVYFTVPSAIITLPESFFMKM
jgi:hypothetical protein